MEIFLCKNYYHDSGKQIFNSPLWSCTLGGEGKWISLLYFILTAVQ